MVKFGPLCFFMGKTVRKSFNRRNLTANDQSDMRYMFELKILNPVGCLPLPRGYIHVYNQAKMFIKSDFKDFETYIKWAK